MAASALLTLAVAVCDLLPAATGPWELISTDTAEVPVERVSTRSVAPEGGVHVDPVPLRSPKNDTSQVADPVVAMVGVVCGFEVAVVCATPFST